jgi:hypothetical protein
MEEIFWGEGMETVELYLGSNWSHTLSAGMQKAFPHHVQSP